MRFLGVLFLKFLSWVVYLSPRAVQIFYGNLLGYLWFDVLRIRRDVIDDNLKRAFPKWDKKKRIKVGRQSCKGMGQAFVEYFLFPHINKDNIENYFHCDSWDNWKEVNEQNKGVYILSLHMGSYDFLSAYLALKGMDIRLISKEFKLKWLNDLWFAIRESMGMKYISDRKAKFEIIKASKEKAAIAFIIDQFAGPPIGIASNFMGQPTGTAKGLSIFHLWTKAPVIPIYNFRRPDNKIEVKFGKEIQLEEKETRDESVKHMTQKYNDELERIIRAHPEQWMWVHKRWKEFKY